LIDLPLQILDWRVAWVGFAFLHWLSTALMPDI
jgi:hypothetical protein